MKSKSATTYSSLIPEISPELQTFSRGDRTLMPSSFGSTGGSFIQPCWIDPRKDSDMFPSIPETVPIQKAKCDALLSGSAVHSARERNGIFFF